MKKATMQSIVTYLTDNLPYADANEKEFLQTTIDELTAELAKSEVKAKANADAYEQAKGIVLGALSNTPVTIGELYDEIATELPDGFTKGKVQYAITRLWADEVVKTEGKVNTYSRKA